MESWIKQSCDVDDLYFVGQSHGNIIINKFTNKNNA